MKVVVSLHDVSPANFAEVHWLAERLDDLDARPRVLKVIPNEAGHAPVARARSLVQFLQAEAAAGSEIVLHGYAHRVAGPIHGTVLDRLRARLFAREAAEFLSLTRDQALSRVDAGREALEELGIRPIGFCPPGWLSDENLDTVLRELGFRYYLTFGALHDVVLGRAQRIPALGYMGADAIEEALVGIERALVLAATPRQSILRVFFHPQGAPRSSACAAVLRSVEKLLRQRTPVTYAALLAA